MKNPSVTNKRIIKQSEARLKKQQENVHKKKLN